MLLEKSWDTTDVNNTKESTPLIKVHENSNTKTRKQIDLKIKSDYNCHKMT